MPRNPLTSPEITKFIKFVLDEWLPPIIRDRRWFYKPIQRAYNKRMDIDFRSKAPFMSDEEFKNAYEKIVPMRSTDMTGKTVEFVLDNLVGETVLEVGCGNGDVSIACAAKGHKVCATDLADGNLEQLHAKIAGQELDIDTRLANVEKLPFPDDSFDVTLCLHTLEHVKNLTDAIAELKRVTRKRVIVIVPRERYFRYTCNYHLNFFGDPEQLMLAMKIEKARCEIIDGALCYTGDLGEIAAVE